MFDNPFTMSSQGRMVLPGGGCGFGGAVTSHSGLRLPHDWWNGRFRSLQGSALADWHPGISPASGYPSETNLQYFRSWHPFMLPPVGASNFPAYTIPAHLPAGSLHGRMSPCCSSPVVLTPTTNANFLRPCGCNRGSANLVANRWCDGSCDHSAFNMYSCHGNDHVGADSSAISIPVLRPAQGRSDSTSSSSSLASGAATAEARDVNNFLDHGQALVGSVRGGDTEEQSCCPNGKRSSTAHARSEGSGDEIAGRSRYQPRSAQQYVDPWRDPFPARYNLLQEFSRSRDSAAGAGRYEQSYTGEDYHDEGNPDGPTADKISDHVAPSGSSLSFSSPPSPDSSSTFQKL
ncbi:uncharacterized protein LOC134536041 isoform X3 [Bacillus rossius redtenbacheri]